MNSPLTILAQEERRYDSLPPWAWRRPMDEVAHVQRKIAALERLMRDNEHAFACDLEQLTRLIARHRMNACILAVQLATDRAALQRLTGGGATS